MSPSLTYEPVSVDPVLLNLLRDKYEQCERLRPLATYNTGSISEAAGVYLYLLCERFRPKTVVEIGTFIGKSARAMTIADTIEVIYTCDKDNDCIPNTPLIRCHPKTISTTMLGTLVEKGVKADFFFFDGRIQVPDLALILCLSHPHTVYVFDDYEYLNGKMMKGVANIMMLHPYLNEHVLVRPPQKVGDLDSKTSIAVLVPKELV